MSTTDGGQLELNEADLERHRYLRGRIKAMVEQLPNETQKRISDQLISDLALSLLDKTALNIITMLKMHQLRREKELLDQRNAQISKIDAKRKTMLEKVERKLRDGKITATEHDDCLKEMQRHYQEKIVSIDSDILHQVDKKVNEQQRMLSDAQIPGFFVTQKSHEIEIQVYLLNFITQIDDLCDESKLLLLDD